jgi:hypothetical protein
VLALAVGLAAAAASTAAARPARADGVDLPRLVPKLAPPWGAAQRDQAADSAPSAADSWATRKKAIMLQGGAPGGPLGYGGASFEFAPVPWFVAGAGGGFSPSGPTGAIWPRLRLPLTHWFAVGFGVPFSFGPYEALVQQSPRCSVAGCPVAFKTTRSWDMAAWVNIEPNVEFRLPHGLALRVLGGESLLVNRHDDRCSSTLANGCPSSIGEKRWYGGFAIGYAW